MRVISLQNRKLIIKRKLLSDMNCEPLRGWYKDNGEENIVQWLNDALHVSDV